MLIPNVEIPEASSGPWKIEKFTVSDKDIGTFRLAMQGRYLPAGTYPRLVHRNRGVVMSDTPAEKSDHYDFVRRAKGHVLINGLGIGMCLNAVLKKHDVEKATVVEIDADVIALSGETYLSDPRVEIINCSAFDYIPPKGIRYGAVWHDIWDSICEDNLEEMATLHRKYGRRCDWQGSWCKEQILSYRARTKNAFWRRK